MEVSMKEMNKSLEKLKEDVELIKNILVSEGEFNEETKKEIEEARERVKGGEFYTEEEAKEILNLNSKL